ncbi:HAD hydrolase family protein, partial [Streptococcus pyogenes]
MIKLIAIDMDGTLLNSQKEISDLDKKTLQKAAKAGIKIVLCTGRPKSGITP